MEREANCKVCGAVRQGKFCHNCGQPFLTPRLTLKGIFHEVFHFLTHFDRGFPFTLKKLIVAPGTMEREYVDGNRANYQKPFSMYFICTSFAALAIYLISEALIHYFDAGDSREARFFHQYWVLLQGLMFPIYALVTYLFYFKSRFNYAEIVVLQLYSFSFLFIALTAIHLFKFLAPDLQTRYIELPFIIGYITITNINFFNETARWINIMKSVSLVVIIYLFASSIQDLFVEKFM